jgi:hypothetical protein
MLRSWSACPCDSSILEAGPCERQYVIGLPYAGLPYAHSNDRCEDFASSDGSSETALYDIITCLSVSKWVHLAQGDEGLRRLFRRAFALLRPGGRFVLEPQPWKSYKKRRRASEHFSAISLRPDGFEMCLLEEVGFAAVEHLGVPEGAVEGFRRPLLCFVKAGEGVQEAKGAHGASE